MGDNDLLCDPNAEYTEKQQKETSCIFRALKVFRKKNLRDATHEEFQQIAKEVEKSHKIAHHPLLTSLPLSTFNFQLSIYYYSHRIPTGLNYIHPLHIQRHIYFSAVGLALIHQCTA